MKWKTKSNKQNNIRPAFYLNNRSGMCPRKRSRSGSLALVWVWHLRSVMQSNPPPPHPLPPPKKETVILFTPHYIFHRFSSVERSGRKGRSRRRGRNNIMKFTSNTKGSKSPEFKCIPPPFPPWQPWAGVRRWEVGVIGEALFPPTQKKISGAIGRRVSSFIFFLLLLFFSGMCGSEKQRWG